MDLAAHFERALHQLKWIDRSLPFGSVRCLRVDSHADVDPEACWLRWAQSQSDSRQQTKRAFLNATGRDNLQRLIEAGWTLRSQWRHAAAACERWVGRRFYFGHSALFADCLRLVSLISSRLGKHGQGHPEWPRWVDAALQHVQRHHCRLLITPDTTLSEITQQFAEVCELPFTYVRWTQQPSVSDWLCDTLTASLKAVAAAACNSQSRSPAGETISTSLDQTSRRATSLSHLELSPSLTGDQQPLNDLPLQDRLSIALADILMALWLRPGGNLERLIELRLDDGSFSIGSVYITLQPPTKAAPNRPVKTQVAVDERIGRWLKRGAVGWIVPHSDSHVDSPLRHCDRSPALRWPNALHQLTAPLPRAWRQLSDDAVWPYLVHCTRGTVGPLPEESLASFRKRMWLRGDGSALHPFETLARICQEGRLRATSNITRTSDCCVSFSAVPLVPLLQRRTFRSHLGRWDWEPYGLIIRRSALLVAGAAEVIYGSEQDYKRLSDELQPLFQPLRRTSGKQTGLWSEEREWRVMGDVWLHSLPSHSILIFVRTQHEARQLSQHVSWPVLWTS